MSVEIREFSKFRTDGVCVLHIDGALITDAAVPIEYVKNGVEYPARPRDHYYSDVYVNCEFCFQGVKGCHVFGE